MSTSYLDLHLEIYSEGRLRTKFYDNRDGFNIPILNFRFKRSTFQQQHMDYISLRWYDIPVLVAPIRLSVIEDAASTEAIETMVPFGNDGVITSKMWLSPPWLGWQLWNICVTMTTDMFHLSKALLGSYLINYLLSGL